MTLLTSVVLLAGCKSGKESKTVQNTGSTICVDEHFADDMDLRNVVDSMAIVLLKVTSDDALFKLPNKCIAEGGRIYIMDYFGNANLTVWNTQGDFLFKVGDVGMGPNEYSQITDFDVCGGKIYILDARLRKLLQYDAEDGAYLKASSYGDKLVGVNGMAVLTDGNFLFGMDVNLNDKQQLVLADEAFEVKREILPFDGQVTRNHLKIGSFKRCGEQIVYNYSISDSVYVFSGQGEMMKKYCLTFKDAVPADVRKDYEMVSRERRNGKLSYFYETPLVNSRYVLSTIYYQSDKAMLWGDLEKPLFVKEVYEGTPKLSLHRFNFPLYMDEDRIICHLDPAYYPFLDDESKNMLDAETVSALEEGDMALVVYYLKQENLNK